jgi:predicted SAM-dependent methyltransferase
MTKITYYPDPADDWWNTEVSKILPYLDGKGVDLCCGRRSINKDVVRLDIDPKKEPQVCASSDNTPFKDGEFDFAYGIHAFEHLPDPDKALKEWLRIVRVGGIIAIVHPDVDYTRKQKSEKENLGLREDPYNKHYFEHNQESFLRWLRKKTKYGFEIMDYGVALGNWSFYVILRKTGEVKI